LVCEKKGTNEHGCQVDDTLGYEIFSATHMTLNESDASESIT